jgi:hypothetical protein
LINAQKPDNGCLKFPGERRPIRTCLINAALIGHVIFNLW